MRRQCTGTEKTGRVHTSGSDRERLRCRNALCTHAPNRRIIGRLFLSRLVSLGFFTINRPWRVFINAKDRSRCEFFINIRHKSLRVQTLHAGHVRARAVVHKTESKKSHPDTIGFLGKRIFLRSPNITPSSVVFVSFSIDFHCRMLFRIDFFTYRCIKKKLTHVVARCEIERVYDVQLFLEIFENCSSCSGSRERTDHRTDGLGPRRDTDKVSRRERFWSVTYDIDTVSTLATTNVHSVYRCFPPRDKSISKITIVSVLRKSRMCVFSNLKEIVFFELWPLQTCQWHFMAKKLESDFRPR